MDNLEEANIAMKVWMEFKMNDGEYESTKGFTVNNSYFNN
jgi:hypothetical protein